MLNDCFICLFDVRMTTAMDDLEIVYSLRQRINRLEKKLQTLTCENVQNNIETNQRTVARICRIEARIIKLKGLHSFHLHHVYSSFSRRTSIQQTSIVMKICQIDLGDTKTTIKMTPNWFKLDQKKNALKDIRYPTDGTDRNLINTIARYRTLIDQSKDFRQHSLEVKQNSIETILIALQQFARQYHGELTFTNEQLSHSHPKEYTAYGIANLACIHLIAANLIPTARFAIKIHLDYDRDLAQSSTTMKTFVYQFHKDLARLLECQCEFIRIFSIEKLDHRRGMVLIEFGLTTPEKNQTESLARQFQVRLNSHNNY